MRKLHHHKRRPTLAKTRRRRRRGIGTKLPSAASSVGNDNQPAPFHDSKNSQDTAQPLRGAGWLATGLSDDRPNISSEDYTTPSSGCLTVVSKPPDPQATSLSGSHSTACTQTQTQTHQNTNTFPQPASSCNSAQMPRGVCFCRGQRSGLHG
ncbi:uncharacterized protein B0I36DRAFT_435081 [Microdochium trichocladiopsis]|uniref:Uncharacterized protein n=1 Tax=Microdochium trichocladiopsis TaxID=1682393 RepID=A0A9P9BI45_9PEZI|nr:uncharacterized protein B0I36DRAFT_435081 [Microdochium trichocladiopsis]KAH7021205.1 hypothetical protein B0I36DRAFT_435081 [Microdochium trichocladiopsis]